MVADCATKVLEKFPRERSRLLSLLPCMKRIGRDQQRENSKNQRLQYSNRIVFEFLFLRACQCSCLYARMTSIRKRGRVRIAVLHCFVVCSLLVFLDAMSVTCPILHPWTQSLHDVHIPSHFLIQTRRVHGLQRSLRNGQSDTSILSHASCCPAIALSFFAAPFNCH